MRSYNYITGTYIGKGGVEIFFQNWTVPNPRGILVIAHGVGEHSGRYGNILHTLDGCGISVFANDHRGHGKSGGSRGHVNSFMEYIYDLKLFIDFIKEENENVPLILMGHSMGGVIAFKYGLTFEEDLAGLILSSAGLVIKTKVPGWKKSLGRVLSRYLPSLTMSTGLKAEELSHDKEVVNAYANDPLVHGKVSTRWFTEYSSVCEECLNRALELRMPLLLFHGKDDAIVDYQGSLVAYNNASSVDKTLHVFDRLYHETMNEVKEDREKVLEVTKKWILHIFSKTKHSRNSKPPISKKIKRKTSPALKAVPAKPGKQKPEKKKATPPGKNGSKGRKR